MKNNDTFLAVYREYESVLRDQGVDYKDIEEKSEDLIQNRLRICRQMRNYLSHNNDAGFLDISDAQIRFLQKQMKEFQLRDDIVKKHLKTPATSAVITTSKCTEAMRKLIKLKSQEILVVNEKTNKFGVATMYEIAKKVLESKSTKMSDVKLTNAYVLVEPTTKMSEIPTDRMIVCTSDGTMEGKLMGVVYR